MKHQPSEPFVALLGRHERILHKVCGVYAFDAEDRKDLFQEIVLQAWRAFPAFRNEARESTWLYRIALNTALTHQRSARRRPGVAYGEEVLLNYPDEATDGDAAFIRLRQIINQLPELEKALVLLYLDEKSHAEIAEIMGISTSNVGTKLARIRDKLKRRFWGIGNWELGIGNW